MEMYQHIEVMSFEKMSNMELYMSRKLPSLPTAGLLAGLAASLLIAAPGQSGLCQSVAKSSNSDFD